MKDVVLLDVKKLLFLSVYFLSPILPIWVLYQSNPLKYQGSKLMVTMILGVIAYTWFTWQFVLSARPKWLDRIFGMDKIYRFHGIIALACIAAGAVHANINETFFKESLQTLFGSVSLYGFIGISVISLLFMVNSFITKMKLFKWIRSKVEGFKSFRYEHYRLMHNLTVIALVFMQAHVLMASSVRKSPLVFMVYMTYFIIGIGFYIYHKLIQPLLLQDHMYTVKKVVQESESMWSIYIQSDEKDYLKFSPGQFGFFTVVSEKVRKEEHPFSIASSPTAKGEMIVTVKELGDFTSGIKNIVPGDKVRVDGPYGRFSYKYYEQEDALVFIVGGVGITPALSMLRHIRDMGERRKVVMLWGMNQTNDFIAKSELVAIEKNMPDVTIIPVVAFDERKQGEKRKGIY